MMPTLDRRTLFAALGGTLLSLRVRAQGPGPGAGPGPGPGAGRRPGAGRGPGPGPGPHYRDRWNDLPEAERDRAEQRFGRGYGPGQGPGPDEMRHRWDSMSPRQREELMWQRHQRMHSPGTGRTPQG